LNKTYGVKTATMEKGIEILKGSRFYVKKTLLTFINNLERILPCIKFAKFAV
jgi:hypothetical protein